MTIKTFTVNCPSWCTTDHSVWAFGALEHHRDVLGPSDAGPEVYVSKWENLDGDPAIFFHSGDAEFVDADGADAVASALKRAAELVRAAADQPTVTKTVSFTTPPIEEIAYAIEGLDGGSEGRLNISPDDEVDLTAPARDVTAMLSPTPKGAKITLAGWDPLTEDEALQVVLDAMRLMRDPATEWQLSADSVGHWWTIDVPVKRTVAA